MGIIEEVTELEREEIKNVSETLLKYFRGEVKLTEDELFNLFTRLILAYIRNKALEMEIKLLKEELDKILREGVDNGQASTT